MNATFKLMDEMKNDELNILHLKADNVINSIILWSDACKLNNYIFLRWQV